MIVLKNSLLMIESNQSFFLCSNKEQTLWKFLHFISLKLRIKMHFGLDWWTDQSKKNPKWTGGLVTSTYFELDWVLVLVTFKMDW